MNPTVIDTLRYADRLKAAGVEPALAEAMSRALNAELTEELVTKTDLDASTTALRTDLETATTALRTDLETSTTALRTELGTLIRELDHKVDAGFAAFDERFTAIDDRFAAIDDRFAATDRAFGAIKEEFASMKADFAALGAKFDGLSSQFASQGRYVFLVLALIAGLGLYNAVAPLGKASQQTGSSQPVAAPIERDDVVPSADSRG